MNTKPETELIRACSSGKPETVRRLLEAGLSPETRDGYGLTGLIWAGRKGQVEVAKVLLEFGASIDAKDRRGRTALHHSVGYKRREFAVFIAARGAFLDPIDTHGCTPLDLAAFAVDEKTIALLESLGAKRVKTAEQVRLRRLGTNGFMLPAIMGGTPEFVEREQQQLRSAFNQWTGDYTDVIKDFVFLLLVDGTYIHHTDREKLKGVQPAKRKRDVLEVTIGISEDWWNPSPESHKRHLASAIEEGLHSMIALLQRNRHPISADLLLSDWERVKLNFLEAPAPTLADELRKLL
jgi:hypothetical protein